MHPQIAEHKNTQCIEVMYDLQECHAANPWKKFLGVCNKQYYALNKCLQGEFEEMRKKQLVLAREKRNALDTKWKEIDEDQ